MLRMRGILLIPVLMLAIFMAACGAEATPTPTPTVTPTPSPTPTPSLFPLTLTDSNGNEVTISRPPERIVAIDGDAVEILFAMGEGHRIVGIHDFVSYPPEVEEIEKVGGAFALNFEKIAALEPDLIVIFFDSPVAELKKLGVQVLYLKTPGTLEGVADQMRSWGKIVNNPGAAEELAMQFEASLDDLQEKLAGVQEGPRVFHDLAPGLWTAGSGTLFNEIYILLKAQNIFGDIQEYKQVSPEELVARDPQVVISTHPEGRDAFKSDPAFQDISAVKEGKLYIVDGALVSVTGPRLVQGIAQMAISLYPDLFP